MRNSSSSSTIVLGVVATLLLVAQAFTARETAGAPAGQRGANNIGVVGGGRRGRGNAPPAGPIRRMPDGIPDLTGSWSGCCTVGLQNVETQRGVFLEPETHKIPYTPEYAARAADIRANHMFDEPELHCLPSGVPHVMFVQFGFQIIQAPRNILMTWDFLNQYRNIAMDGRPHIPADLKLFQGDSIGHWEGDVLVIETTNQNDRTWFDTVGHIHSDEIRVVERFIPVDENTIRYEAVVEDPKALTEPFKVTDTFRRNANPNWEQLEFACVEGNRDMERYTEGTGGPAKAGEPGSNAPPGAVSAPRRGFRGRGQR